MTKTCTGCKQPKPIETSFTKGRGYKGGYRSECKKCERERLNAWRRSHPIQARAQWARSNGKRIYTERRALARRDAYLRRKYKITLADYNAMFKRQRGRCAICRRRPVTNAGRFRLGQGVHPQLCVDHCHRSGRVRSLLCNSCNISIEHARESPRILRSMIAYLRFHNGC